MDELYISLITEWRGIYISLITGYVLLLVGVSLQYLRDRNMIKNTRQLSILLLIMFSVAFFIFSSQILRFFL